MSEDEDQVFKSAVTECFLKMFRLDMADQHILGVAVGRAAVMIMKRPRLCGCDSFYSRQTGPEAFRTMSCRSCWHVTVYLSVVFE